MKKFNYQSNYKKFKNGDNVKISFKDAKDTVTKNVKIISIDSKKIAFEDKINIYECVPSEIIYIKKRILKKLFLVFVCCLILLYLCFVGLRVWKYEEYKKACERKAIEETPLSVGSCGGYVGKVSIFTGCSLTWYESSYGCGIPLDMLWGDEY